MASALNLPHARRPHHRRAARKCGTLPAWLAMPAPQDLEHFDSRSGKGRRRFSRAVAIAFVLSIALWAGIAALLFALL